ncbi:MAG: hypothetical protein JSW58_04580 [Candidatus Latescibacterota bacterium]|nr:MAG: hypothetical protein JSW58_04580 [Candidatus Latescibacterota bacterium]
MDIRTSIAKRRVGVVVNYASLTLFLLLYYIGFIGHWSAVLTIGVLIFLAVATVSFIFVHIKTGLWRLAHSSREKLDERQIQVTHEALRYSYSVFAVICLLIMLFNAVTGYRGHYLFDAVLPMSLLYFAHSLPSSVIAWTEREV